MPKDLPLLEQALNLKFKDSTLLQKALTHRSYLNENIGLNLEHNERLEFLGDAVLEFVITEYLYTHYLRPEGELTNWRASLVNSDMLAKVATHLNLGDYLYLSKGENKDESRGRQYILANATEALIGAIYLDLGINEAKKFIGNYILTRLPYILENQLYIDPKSHFQEVTQEKTGITPHYEVMDESGPDHAKTFKVGVYLNSDLIGVGTGYSKQEAEFNAAKLALEKWQ